MTKWLVVSMSCLYELKLYNVKQCGLTCDLFILIEN
jgi:hypothetical protein